jgi:hypothetical protein
MSDSVGQLDFQCDAPEYSIVRECETVGLQSPLDVRWCRMTLFLAEYAVQKLRKASIWQRLLGAPEIRALSCACGEGLPGLGKYLFEFSSGRKETYFLGQCPRCRTIFWDDARTIGR